MFEVSLISINDTARTVDVFWDFGVQRTFKWCNIVIDEGDAVPLPSASDHGSTVNATIVE